MEYGDACQIKQRIQKALVALSNEPDLTIAAAARNFFVSLHRLRQRAKGKKLRM